MRILLLCSAFNGLSQRAWIELRDEGHDVTVELAINEATIVSLSRWPIPISSSAHSCASAFRPRCGRATRRSSCIPARRAIEGRPHWTGP